MSHTRLVVSYSIAAVLAGAGLQQVARGDDERPEATTTDADSIRLTLADRRIAANLAIDCQAEIQLAQFAAFHARDPSVKGFAESMARQYESLAGQMDTLSGSLASAIWNTTTEEDARPRSPIRMINLERTLLRIKLEIVRECAGLLQGELQSLPADEFDRSYLRAHVLRQIQMLGTLKALERHASSGYATTLVEARKMVQQELDQAKTIGATLEATTPKSADGTAITAAGRK